MDLPVLRLKDVVAPYNEGDIHYKNAIKNLTSVNFTLYHGGYLRLGLAGIHWTGHKDVAKKIAANSTGNVVSKEFNRTDKFVRIDDGVEYNNLLYYTEQLWGKKSATYKQLVDVTKAFLKDPKNADYLVKGVRNPEMTWMLDASFRKMEKPEAKLCETLIKIFATALQAAGIDGLVYYNEFEDKGDSFITFNMP